MRTTKSNLYYAVLDLAWNPHDETQVVSAATNNAIVLWDIESRSRNPFVTFKGHTRTANRVCWHPTDGNRMLSGSTDGTVKVWDTREEHCVTSIQRSSGVCKDVQFSPHQGDAIVAFTLTRTLTITLTLTLTVTPPRRLHRGRV